MVFAALNCTPVDRLKRTYAEVTPQSKRAVIDIRALFAPDSSSKVPPIFLVFFHLIHRTDVVFLWHGMREVFRSTFVLIIILCIGVPSDVASHLPAIRPLCGFVALRLGVHGDWQSRLLGRHSWLHQLQEMRTPLEGLYIVLHSFSLRSYNHNNVLLSISLHPRPLSPILQRS